MTELLQNRTQGTPHTRSQKNHTMLMRPASKRRAEQAAIIHLLVISTGRGVSRSFFSEENTQAMQDGKGFRDSGGRGSGVQPMPPLWSDIDPMNEV